MLKYHPVIIGRLIHEGLVVLEDDRLSIQQQKAENIVDAINYHQYRELETNRHKVTKVVASTFDMERAGIYLKVNTSNPSIFNKVDGFVFNSNFESTNAYFCHPKALSQILTSYKQCPQTLDQSLGYEKTSLYSIEMPKGYRVPKELRCFYLELIENQIEDIKDKKAKGYCMSNLEYRYDMYSYKDYGVWPNKTWYDNIEKCGIMAYRSIYNEIEWDFDLVDKYKEQILWLNLIEDSNLIWTEEDILKFDSFIPHDELRSSKLYGNNYIPAAGYGKISILSNEYIESHKDVINWEVFTETAEFVWTPDDLKHFFEYAKSIGKEFGMYELSKNQKFKWSPELFSTMIELEPSTLEYCINDNKFSDLLFALPNYQEIVKKFNDNPDYWRELHDGGKKKHNAYSEFFTIENINENKNEWNKELEDKFITMRRTPDTNYHFHAVFTMWDYFEGNSAIKLSYDLCLCLKKTTVVLGGSYILEDGCYVGEDNRFPEYNGLDVFGNHDIENITEIEKICNDDALIDAFLNRTYGDPNQCIVDYLIERFFDSYSLDNYISIVNNMKDWDSIVKFRE